MSYLVLCGVSKCQSINQSMLRVSDGFFDVSDGNRIYLSFVGLQHRLMQLVKNADAKVLARLWDSFGFVHLLCLQYDVLS